MNQEDERRESWRIAADERYYRICKMSFLFGIVQHTLLAVLFAQLNVTLLSHYNIISILVFSISYFYNEKRRFHRAMTIAYIEIIVHQVLATIFIGWDTGFHAYILFCIMIPLLTSRGHANWKLFISGSSFVSYLLLLLFCHSREPLYEIPSSVFQVLLITNEISFIAILVLIAYLFNGTVLDFEEKLEAEFQYARGLLLNILPESISERVGRNSERVADGYDRATVLFADIVNFTPLAESTSPERLVELLDHLFTRFDLLTDRWQCEKIKTIGDAYMVASGVPEESLDHAFRVTSYGLDMLEEIRTFNEEEGVDLAIRIGIHTGPLVAGVIGLKKFSYDLWGDTVNTASRMESSGVVGAVQITGDTKRELGEGFLFQSRGTLMVKGKGEIEAFLVSRMGRPESEERV